VNPFTLLMGMQAGELFKLPGWSSRSASITRGIIKEDTGSVFPAQMGISFSRSAAGSREKSR